MAISSRTSQIGDFLLVFYHIEYGVLTVLLSELFSFIVLVISCTSQREARLCRKTTVDHRAIAFTPS